MLTEKLSLKSLKVGQTFQFSSKNDNRTYKFLGGQTVFTMRDLKTSTIKRTDKNYLVKLIEDEKTTD